MVVAGCLTRNNLWVFEGRGRSHSSRWNELKSLFKKERSSLAEPFYGLFNYLFRNVHKESVSLEEFVIEGKRPTPMELSDALPEFLSMIPRVRHGSLYHSFGSDIYVYTDLVNRDAFSGHGLRYQADAFYEFASSLLAWSVRNLLNLSSSIELSDSARVALMLVVHHPWFDLPELEQVPDPEVRAAAKELWRGLHPRP